MNFKKFTLIVSGILLTFLFIIGFFIANRVMSEDIDNNEGLFTLFLKQIKPRNEVVNVLLMGLDKGGLLTDTIVVANYNLGTGKVSLLSIPRDTKVIINNTEMKINSAYGVGKQEGAVNAVSSLLNTDIHYYAMINIEAFKKVIDLLDGVDMDIPEDMAYEDPFQNLKIDLKKGHYVLDGNKAEQYMRYRSGYVEGDVGRVKAQKQFFEALLNQKLKPKYITKVDDIIKAVMDNMVTNVKPTDIPRLAKGLGKIKAEEIQYFILPGKGINNAPYYYIHDAAAVEELVAAYFRNGKAVSEPKNLPQINEPPAKANPNEPFTPPTLNIKPSEAPPPVNTPKPSLPTPAPENPSRPVPPPLPSYSPAG